MSRDPIVAADSQRTVRSSASVTSIPLHLIDANPFHDAELNPLDPPHVAVLAASMAANGTWAGMVVRRTSGGRYQCAFGHHRIAAAAAAGLTDIPVELRELDDMQMALLLASENATQRGAVAAACLDAVAAISQVLAYSLIRHDQEWFCQNWQNLAAGYPELRGRLDVGAGIGRDCILKSAPAKAFTRHQVELALGVLKDSGRMAAIVADARGRAEREIVDAAAEAEQKTSAPTLSSAAPPTVPRKQVKAASVPAVVMVPATLDPPAISPIFDARCAQLFHRDAHLTEFRRIVTDDVVRSYLPVEKQYAIAEQVLTELKERDLTARNLREKIWDVFYRGRGVGGLGISRKKLRTAKERPVDDRLKDGRKQARDGIEQLQRGCQLLQAIAAERGRSADLAHDTLDTVVEALTTLLTTLHGTPTSEEVHLASRTIDGELAHE